MTSPSWQPDPSGRHESRWWDGQRWTEHVNDHGLTSIDPLSHTTPPAPAADAAAGPPPTVHQPTQLPPTAEQPTVAQPTVAQPAVTPPIAAQPTTAQPRAGQAAYRPTVQQPTVAQQAYYDDEYDEDDGPWDVPPPNRIPLVVGGIVAVLAIGIGAFFILNRKDHATTLPASTTAPITTDTALETTLPSSTTTTQPATTTTVLIDGPLLAAIMPTNADVPATWKRIADANPSPQSKSGPGVGFCGGANAVGRAQLAGSNAVAHGPAWNLPDHSVFSVDVYTFPSTVEASAYLTAILKDANACNANPVNFTVSEADAHWFDDPTLNGTQWTVEEDSSATKSASTTADAAVQGSVDDHYTTTVQTTDYAITNTTLMVYERWGSTVLTYSLNGRWGDTGWSQPSPKDHQPTVAEVLAAAQPVRTVLLQRLKGIGLH